MADTPINPGVPIVAAAPGIFDNPIGATLRPIYAERNPPMWPVGEVDIKAISDDSLVANIAFSLGSFFLGFSVNILVDYSGVDKLTELGAAMLHKACPLLFVLSVVFFVAGGVMTYRKNAIWGQIKKESKPRS